MRRLLGRLRLPPTAATLLVQGIDMGSQVLVGVLIARGLGPAAMGHFTFALAVAGILAIVVLWGAGEVAVSLYAGGEEEPGAVLEASLRALGRGAVATVAAASAIVAVLRPEGPAVLALALAVAALLANGLASTFNYAILGRRASARDLPVVAASRAILLAGVVAGVLAGSLPLALLGTLLGALALALGRGWLVHRTLFPLRPRRDDRVRAIFSRRGRWIGLSSVFGTVSARLDMLLLQRLAPATELGLYGACYRIINGIATGASANAQALFPGLVSGVPATQARARRLSRLLSLALSAVPLLTLPFAGAVVVAIYGEGWRDAGTIFSWLLAASALQVQTAFRSRRLVADGRERLLPVGQGLAALVNVGANLALIPALGALGAAVATFAAEAAALSVYLAGPALLAALAARRAPRPAPAGAAALLQRAG